MTKDTKENTHPRQRSLSDVCHTDLEEIAYVLQRSRSDQHVLESIENDLMQATCPQEFDMYPPLGCQVLEIEKQCVSRQISTRVDQRF